MLAGLCALLLVTAPPSRPDAVVAPAAAHKPPPTLEHRLLAAGGSGLGGFIGGLVGASTAIAAGAALSDVNAAAQPLPYFVLPPALSAVGAALGGGAVAGTRAAWAGGVAAFLGAGGATLGVGLLLLDGDNDPGTLFIIETGAPALAAAASGALAAGALVEE